MTTYLTPHDDGLLSIVLPSYCEEGSVPLAAARLCQLLGDAGLNFELIFVDDGSKDGTWAAIEREHTKNPAVRGVHFSRNFGKESAIFAGLAHSRGDCTVVMDCDLQHPPEKVLEMYQLWREGYQVVEGVKTSRGKESAIHTLMTKIFYGTLSSATGIDMANASDFKLLDRRAVDVLLTLREKNAFFRALSSWIGFTTARVTFEVQPRVAGETKWSFFSLVRYAITNLAAFSTAPLQLVTILGTLVFLVSLVLGGVALWQKINGQALEGFTTVILLLLLIGSILMISLGILGYYIAKIYEELKNRPRYIDNGTTEQH